MECSPWPVPDHLRDPRTSRTRGRAAHRAPPRRLPMSHTETPIGSCAARRQRRVASNRILRMRGLGLRIPPSAPRFPRSTTELLLHHGHSAALDPRSIPTAASQTCIGDAAGHDQQPALPASPVTPPASWATTARDPPKRRYGTGSQRERHPASGRSASPRAGSLTDLQRAQACNCPNAWSTKDDSSRKGSDEEPPTACLRSIDSTTRGAPG